MLTERWIVETLPERVHDLPNDLKPYTRVDCRDGKALLVYREAFTACEVAVLAGGKVLLGHILTETGQADGDMTWLDHRDLLLTDTGLDFRTLTPR